MARPETTGNAADLFDASVVVPTRNRKRLLLDAVEALWAQTLAPDRFEIIVVDNRSTDGTDAMMRELQARSPCRLTYIVMPENRGPARSRNAAARAARGAVLAFTDDDCRPAPEWLERGLEAFRDSRVALASGTVLYKPEQVGTTRFFTREVGQVTSENATYTWTNTFYRRAVFLELGGTDESLCRPDFRNRVVDCGDTDLAWRLKDRGYANTFVAEAVVYHELEDMAPLNWVFEPFRLFVVPQLVRRHPRLRKALLHWGLFFVPANAALYLAAIGLAGALLHRPMWLLLAAPYAAWLGRMGWQLLVRGRVTAARLVKTAGQVAFVAGRHAVMCAALVYGSVRFRTVVL
jgi:glycosyltransferase involved in cell wall biosynthesis